MLRDPAAVNEPALLELSNVTVMRGQRVVLEDFDLTIHGHERVVILGPNGCGKSTLIRTITRECYPVARRGSSITIMGRTSWNVGDLRSMLGIVANDSLALSDGRVCGRDVVLSGFFSSTGLAFHHHVSAEQRRRAGAALEELGIGHLADRPVGEMSSGEARRVLIARALVHRPKALLFDEPCNSLDVSARHALRETMRSLARSGTGIILVTHDLADVIPEIDRVLLMSKGRIVADGTKEEMLQPGKLAGAFGIEVAIARHEGYYHLW